MQNRNKDFPTEKYWKDFNSFLATTINSFILKWRHLETPENKFFKTFKFLIHLPEFELVDPSFLFKDTKEFLTHDLLVMAQELGYSKDNVEFLKKQPKLLPSGETLKAYLTDKVDYFILDWRAHSLVNDPSKDLRNLWKEVAEQNKLTQKEFCKKTGIPSSTFNDWYTGKTKKSYCESIVAFFIVVN